MPPIHPADPAPSPAPVPPDDALAWDAFRYLSNELTAPETTRFERRLARDQAARLALADAVELFGALRLVADEFRAASPRRSRRRHPLRRLLLPVGLGSAAAVLVAALGLVALRSGSTGDGLAVAVAWTDLRNQTSGGDPGGSVGAESSAGLDPAAADGDAPEITELASPEQPVSSWILATVAPTTVDPNLPLPEGN